jgi:hypothetical protein
VKQSYIFHDLHNKMGLISGMVRAYLAFRADLSREI